MDGILLDLLYQFIFCVRKVIVQVCVLGVYIVLISGCLVFGLVLYLYEFGINGNDDYCIVCNGGLVQCIGICEIVVEYLFSFDDFLFCEQVVCDLGVYFQVLDSQCMYMFNQDISYYIVVDLYFLWMLLLYCCVEDMDLLMFFIKLMMIDVFDVLDVVIVCLFSVLIECFVVLKSVLFFLEVFDYCVGKGLSLQKLVEYLGIDCVNVMVIGDQENDLIMLQYVGISVVMGNVIDVVKVVVWFEISSNVDEGVVCVIEVYVLC